MEGALLSAPVDEYLMVFGTGEVGVAEQLLQAGLLRCTGPGTTQFCQT